MPTTRREGSALFIRKILTGLAVFALVGIALLGFVAPAHAVAPAIVQSSFSVNVATNCVGVSNCKYVNFTNPVVVGDLIVLQINFYSTSNSQVITANFGTGTTAASQAVIAPITLQTATLYAYDATFYGVAVDTGKVVRVSSSQALGPGGSYWIAAWEVSNVNTLAATGSFTNYASGTCDEAGHTSSCGTAWTDSPMSTSASDMFVSCGLNAQVGVPSAGAGYTKVTDSGGDPFYYGIDPSKPANCLTTGSAGVVNMAGAAFIFTNPGPSTQSQTLGSCPNTTPNSATFTPVNSTMYMYQGSTLGPETVNTVQVAISSVTGTQTLRLLIYSQQITFGGAASISAGFPLIKITDLPFVLTASATPQIITAQINSQLGIQQGSGLISTNIWGVGVVANDHIVLNQSAISGMFTFAANASTSSQPSKYTAQGTGVSTKLSLCAIALFQSVLFVTTTTTAAASTTTTQTITFSTINQAAAAGTTIGFTILLIIILTPALLIAGVLGATTHNAPTAAAGFVAGLTIGAGLGNYAGLVPAAWLYITVILDILMLLVVFSANRG